MVAQFIFNGKSVNNHIVVIDTKGTSLQSYNTLVVRVSKKGKITLSSYWDCSSTTCKNVCHFLSKLGFVNYEHKKDVQNAINDKKIKVVSTLA